MPKKKPPGRRKSVAATGSDPNLVRKNFYVDQRKLDLAKRVLGVDTETEAVDRALARLSFAWTLIEGLEALAAVGGVEDFEPGDEIATARRLERQRRRRRKQRSRSNAA